MSAHIIGATGVNGNNGSTRVTSNSMNQQTNNSARQQSNNNSASNSALNDATAHSSASAIFTTNHTPLTDLPLEIFERIFQYTGYKEVSNMRMVSELKEKMEKKFFAIL